ncbi:hypothetical protein A3D72_02970 [Candidatus Uhrbacteria bacterium RIFCSPHIGHO2_02_FULL_57_19]|uniref:Uncharacterized protein n=1 Tax=Candidatus Uhrbacteria bacterium RIFCSPHIGHO2_02_FULL_57_19 TaxID=1802391 RepID=A0A1F7U3P3_9BACT|nr:MAG: hypothetical protein A3D72_02970 [Candidatus Uhrbacteria bacterium RIFCSPHIGHO2_02_FULL_57_19]
MNLPDNIRSPQSWREHRRRLKPTLQALWRFFVLSGKALRWLSLTIYSLINLMIYKIRKGRGPRRPLPKLPKINLRAAFSFILTAGALLLVVGGLSGAAAVAWLGRALPDPSNIQSRSVAQSTKIYDRTGEHLLYEIHGDEKRTIIELSDIPEQAIKATIAIEDKDFYKHGGFSLRGIFRAAWVNLRRGGTVQGGSTITQQFVKNAILTDERSVTRKLKELVLAFEMERRFSKDEILKLYFNEIPYGSTSYGIESAAQTFFGKRARDLDLVEGAMLAALPKAPTKLSPYGSNTEALAARTRYILDAMAEEGYISRDQAGEAKKVDILARVKPRRESIEAPHFVLYVKEMISEKYGEKLVERGGLKVITSLDYDKQKIAEKAVFDGMAAVEKSGGSNAALVALDPQTGEILAMVGSRDYFNEELDGQVNVTTRPRQPGSSFKPIVYAAAFEKGFTPGTVLWDVNTTFITDTKPYAPKNYDLAEHGPVTARTALAGSLNIPAVKMIYLTGIGKVLDFADKLGYTTLRERSRFGLSLVLGGGEVKLLEHVSAFGVFGNDGIRQEPVAVLKVEGPDGRPIEEWKPGNGNKVVEPEVSRNITDVLSDNAARAYVFGESNYLTLPGRPVAAKTGTTNDFRDAWTVGYTPQITAGVWTGNNDNSEMKRGADGSKIAAPIWNQFMREALAIYPAESFRPPAPIATGKPILDGQLFPETRVRVDRITGKLANDFTPLSTAEERVYREVHDTLFYLKKDDPRGVPPENPYEDPQFSNWELAVQEWAARQDPPIVAEKPPTEYDDVHVAGNLPVIRITSPSEGSAIPSRDLTISVEASAPRGVRRVTASLDGIETGSSTIPPFTIQAHINNRVGVGFHRLEVWAYDDVENSAAAVININIIAAPDSVSVFWAAPSNGARVSSANFPLTVSASISDANGVDSVDFIAENITENETLIGSVPNPGKNLMVVHWENAAPGIYRLKLRLQTSGGPLPVPDTITVTVE